jgi:glycosyltransferase involved in cell wall biosynthesis
MRLFPRREAASRRLLRRLGRSVIESLGLARRHKKALHQLVAPGRVPWGPDTAPQSAAAGCAGSGGGRPRGRIVLVSGEPETPGHAYRVARLARAADALGHEVDVLTADELCPAWWRDRIPAPAIVIVWRARARPPLEKAIEAWRAAGASILFDVDDLMIDPALATPQVIDGIRSMGLATADVRATYEGMRRAMLLADACLAPTAALAEAIERAGRPCLVLPNGFDEETYRVSREAALRRRGEPPADGLFRIGYASGSRTHQRDFAVAAPAVARLLARRPDCRLVLFREPRRGTPLLDVEEFPALAGLEDRIEWRALVPLARLPEELARFDVNLAPLEVGNPFCEAKSELKYFEAALVEVPTIASPTAPFRGSIRHGQTGLLADSTDSWHAHLEALGQDAALRHRLGRAALHDVLHRYGPDGRRERLRTVLARLHGPPEERSQAFRPHATAAGGAQGTDALQVPEPVPAIPPFDVLRRTGSTRIADVAVVVPLFNYGHYVLEALESVAAQSLASVELVVVDDASTDDSVALVDRWITSRGGRFVSATLARNRENAGLALTRNAAFSLGEAAFVFPLDADNTLEPRCLAALFERLARSTASAAHPTLQHFGATHRCRPAEPWSPDRLRRGNYIDAMALIRRSAWAAVGGYRKGAFVGWEDYDLWCRFVEKGFWSEAVPEAVAGYRVHPESMMRQQTNPALDAVVAAIRAEHPWLTVRAA